MNKKKSNNGKSENKNKHESFTYSIIDSIPTALLITGKNDEILLFNNTFVQLWQIPKEIVETNNRKKIFAFLDLKLEQDKFFESLIAYLKENPFEAQFHEINEKSGRFIECYTLPRWINNIISGRVWSFTDVSQQKHSEQLLVNQKQELNNAHRIALLGSWTYNLESKEMKWSDSFSKMCEGLLVHKNFESLLSVIHSDDIEQTKSFFSQFMVEREIKINEFKYRIVNKNEDIYYLKTIVELEHQKNNPVLVLGITQDITQQALMEKSLASAKEAAEDYNLAKDNIFSNISHEMRTPLNAILGYTKILSQISNDELQKDYINSIKTSGESLLSLIEDILYISKVNKEKIKTKEDKVNIRNLVNELHGVFSQKFKQKNIKFSVDVNKEIPENILIDKVRIKQILINLISNSLKFTNKGYVSVKFGGKASLYSDLFDLIIYVEDTGIGIAEKNQQKIFDSFLQLENSTKRNYEGVGLGLYITKRNVELLGGGIKLHSSINKGSLFIITLNNLKVQVGSAKYSEKDHHKINSIQFNEASILVADDQEFNREILRYLLSQFNFEIFEVENGNDAILLAEKFKPSLIIMDLKMPKIDGYNALKKLLINPETKNIPVIAFSSYEKGINKENMLKYGFSDFLSKPVTFSKTIKVLRRFLDYKQIDSRDKPGFLFDIKDLLNDSKRKNLLKKTLFDSLDKLNKKKTVKEQIEFANKLVEFGQKNKFDFLKKKGELLLRSLKLYDIDKSREIIEELSQLLKKINS